MTRPSPTVTALLLVLAALVPARAHAQTVDVRAMSFGIGGGWSVPVRDTRDVYQTGFIGEAYLRFDFGKQPFAIRADLTYQNLTLRSSAIPEGATPAGGTGSLLAGLGCAQWYLAPGSVRPYLLAGGGLYSVRAEYDDPSIPSSSDARFGARGGAGVLLTFGSLLLFAESSLDHVFPGGQGKTSGALDIVPVTVGVNF